MKVKLLLFFALLNFALHAQTDTTKDYDKARFILSPGVLYQKQFMGELNVMYAKTIFGHGYIGSWGPRLGIESNFNPNMDFVVSKFISNMENIAVHVANNKIDKDLLHAILSSIIYEDDYSEELKLKIFQALSS